MSDIAIRVENLGKRYRLGARERYKALRDVLANPFRRTPPAETIWALRNVSFEIKAGEVVGIIGRNGAGKSTLLKILAQITEPTEGWAEIRGRVGSLLEVGTGFHPELTGRENIYLNGAILGMRKTEIDRKFDEIVAFAEVEKFIDTPVKHYSSGMQMRLAFAVAAHLEPEILLVDEVLAVGDASFQKKCLGKMEVVAKQGRTVLFVSHNMGAVSGLCRRALLLERGNVAVEGATASVIETYLRQLESAACLPLCARRDRYGDGFAKITGLRIQNATDPGLYVIRSCDRLRIELDYQSDRPLCGAAFMVGIYTMLNQPLYRLDSEGAGGIRGSLPRAGTLVCETDPINLSAGRYFINLAIMMRSSVVDHVMQAAYFDVEAVDFYGTGMVPPPREVPVLLPQRWQLRTQ